MDTRRAGQMQKEGLRKLDDCLLTDEEAAEYASQSPRTIRRWRQQGRLPYYRLGGVRIKKSDLDALIEQHRIDATATPTSDLKTKLQQISRTTLQKQKRPDPSTTATPQKERTKEKVFEEIHERENPARASEAPEEHIREGSLVFTVREHAKLREFWGDQFADVMTEMNLYHERKPIQHPYKLGRAWKRAPAQPEPRSQAGEKGERNDETRSNRTQDTRHGQQHRRPGGTTSDERTSRGDRIYNPKQ